MNTNKGRRRSKFSGRKHISNLIKRASNDAYTKVASHEVVASAGNNPAKDLSDLLNSLKESDKYDKLELVVD